jgi:hypothetical protein
MNPISYNSPCANPDIAIDPNPFLPHSLVYNKHVPTLVISIRSGHANMGADAHIITNMYVFGLRNNHAERPQFAALPEEYTAPGSIDNGVLPYCRPGAETYSR